MANNGTLLYITCYCGLARLLPEDTDMSEGAVVTLAPCPKCGAGFSGIVVDGNIVVPE